MNYHSNKNEEDIEYYICYIVDIAVESDTDNEQQSNVDDEIVPFVFKKNSLFEVASYTWLFIGFFWGGGFCIPP